jgi:hypothetical protein
VLYYGLLAVANYEATGRDVATLDHQFVTTQPKVQRTSVGISAINITNPAQNSRKASALHLWLSSNTNSISSRCYLVVTELAGGVEGLGKAEDKGA